MSMEECKLCGVECTPWTKINGHICIDCSHLDKWVSVLDKMPEKDGRYLVVEKYNSMIWVGVASMRQGKFDMPVTHWMSLPSAPE